MASQRPRYCSAMFLANTLLHRRHLRGTAEQQLR